MARQAGDSRHRSGAGELPYGADSKCHRRCEPCPGHRDSTGQLQFESLRVDAQVVAWYPNKTLFIKLLVGWFWYKGLIPMVWMEGGF